MSSLKLLPARNCASYESQFLLEYYTQGDKFHQLMSFTSNSSVMLSLPKKYHVNEELNVNNHFRKDKKTSGKNR